MTDLAKTKAKIMERVSIQGIKKLREEMPHQWIDGMHGEHSRLLPIILELLQLVEAQDVALEYYEQFARLPEDIQLKERIGGGKAWKTRAETEERLRRLVE